MHLHLHGAEPFRKRAIVPSEPLKSVLLPAGCGPGELEICPVSREDLGDRLVPVLAGVDQGGAAVVGGMVGLAAVNEQEPHNCLVPVLAGVGQGREAVVVGMVGHGPVLQQQLSDCHVPVMAGD